MADTNLFAREKPLLRAQGLCFEEWYACLLADANVSGMVHNAEELDVVALRQFWKRGVRATIRGLLEEETGPQSKKLSSVSTIRQAGVFWWAL